MKGITEQDKKLLKKYNALYLKAIDDIIEVYEQKDVKTWCPMCSVGTSILHKEDYGNSRCSFCLWTLIEHRGCFDWLHSKNFYSFTKLKRSDRPVKAERIEMLRDWRKVVERLS